MASGSAAPMATPTTVPPSARQAIEPVDAALVRSTDSVPSTTQNPCWTLERSAIATAAAIASAARMLLMNHTERTLAWRSAYPATSVTPDRWRLAGGVYVV